MSTGQGVVAVLYGWEGNRRSGVAPAVRRRPRDIAAYGLNGLKKVNEYFDHIHVTAKILDDKTFRTYLYILRAVRCPYVRNVRNVRP